MSYIHPNRNSGDSMRVMIAPYGLIYARKRAQNYSWLYTVGGRGGPHLRQRRRRF